MFSKFKIEKAPSALYRREPSHFEVEQSAISLPLLKAYDQRIRHLRAENEQLRAEKVEHVKIINGQATELAERRAEVFQLRQELQLLRHEVSQKKNTVKFNISQQNLNQSSQVSLQNFLDNYSVLYSPVAVYSFQAISKESL